MTSQQEEAKAYEEAGDVRRKARDTCVEAGAGYYEASVAYTKARNKQAWEAFNKAWAIYKEAWVVYNKACDAHDEAWNAYIKARIAYDSL